MAFVYWIKLPEPTEIDSQGYIGITDKTPEARHNLARKFGGDSASHT